MRLEFQRKIKIYILFLLLFIILTRDFRISKNGYFGERFERKTTRNLNISTNNTSWTRIWNKYGEGYGSAIVLDSSNDIFVGATSGGYLNLIKYNSSGDVLWDRIWSDERAEKIWCNSLAVDSLNNLYIAGSMRLTSLNEQDMILLKFDNGGNEMWNVSWERKGVDFCNDMTIDSLNNIYLVGYIISNQINFKDISLVKFNSSGAQVWNVTLAGNGFDEEGNALAIDSDDNLYIGGRYNDNGILIKLNTTGLIQWNATFNNYHISEVTIDSSDNIIASGTRALFKLNSSGFLLWNQTIERSFSESLVSDSSDNIYVAQNRIVKCIDNSFFSDSLCICTDIYIEKFNQEGLSIWEKRITGCSDESCSGIALDSLGNLYMSGTLARNVILMKNPEEYNGRCFEFYWDLFLVIIIPSSLISFTLIYYFLKKKK